MKNTAVKKGFVLLDSILGLSAAGLIAIFLLPSLSGLQMKMDQQETELEIWRASKELTEYPPAGLPVDRILTKKTDGIALKAVWAVSENRLLIRETSQGVEADVRLLEIEEE